MVILLPGRKVKVCFGNCLTESPAVKKSCNTTEMVASGTGIALNAEQWSAVKTHAALVSEALQAGTEDFSFKLSAQRKLHVRRMGKNLSVDIREFYKKDGEDAPGKKGVHLKGISVFRLELCLPCDELYRPAFIDLLSSDSNLVCAGINLQADQWEALVSATADIDAELQALGASASPKPQATTKGTHWCHRLSFNHTRP